jgi:hypothetical protein
MATSARFSRADLEVFQRAKILGVRSGSDHRYTAVWVVVVQGRVFVRSWSDKPTGWYQAFRTQPAGSLQLEGREIDVRAVQTRSAKLRQAVSEAYAEKYDTKGSVKWVEGFAKPERAGHTLELIPLA